MRYLLLIASSLFLLFAIPSYAGGSYGRADNRAYRVPTQYNDDLDELTAYLIQPFKKDEELKARVIFAWIVYHIQYDAYEYKNRYEQRLYP